MRRFLHPDGELTALANKKRSVRHVPLCAGMLPLQLSLCRTLETRTTEYAAAVATGEIRPPPPDRSVDVQDTVVFRTLPVADTMMATDAKRLGGDAGVPPEEAFRTSVKRYIQLAAAPDKARMAPVWMSLLLLLRWRGLGVRLTCVTVQPPGFPSFVVWPLLHMVPCAHDDDDDDTDANADAATTHPPPPTVFLPTHDAWDNGFVCYRFGGVTGLPFHLLAARTELFMSAVAVILLRCRWPPRDRDVRIDEVRSDADRTTFRVRTYPSTFPPPEEEEEEEEKAAAPPPLDEVSPISVRFEDDVYGLTMDHRRGYHAPLMVGGGLDGLIVRYVCPGCTRTNDAAAAHGATGMCRACGFYLPDAMVDGRPIRFAFRLRPQL